MSATESDEKAKKAAKKAKLKAEAEKLGISYDDLKAQKKEKKRKREADKLSQDNTEYEGGKDRQSEKKRMRSWSGDFAADDTTKKETPKASATSTDEVPEAKRRRTRSMDKAEENAAIISAQKSISPTEWRKENNITVRGYGSSAGDSFPDPFIEFGDAPFSDSIQKTLKSAGFERPTFIQSQVSC